MGQWQGMDSRVLLKTTLDCGQDVHTLVPLSQSYIFGTGVQGGKLTLVYGTRWFIIHGSKHTANSRPQNKDEYHIQMLQSCD